MQVEERSFNMIYRDIILRNAKRGDAPGVPLFLHIRIKGRRVKNSMKCQMIKKEVAMCRYDSRRDGDISV